jgi:hypothetical protein
MEFLMSYGWALLIVLIALGALVKFGAFSTNSSSSCRTGTPMICKDVQATGNTVALVLGSTGTNTASVTSLNVDAPLTVSNCTSGLPAQITDASTTVSVACLGSMTPGDKFTGSAIVQYQLKDSPINHNSIVQFKGTVE